MPIMLLMKRGEELFSIIKGLTLSQDMLDQYYIQNRPTMQNAFLFDKRLY